MEPIVSIVCLCYNHSAFIRQALDGFVMQKTSFPIEIVIHDDASTDDSVKIIKEYEGRFPNLFHCIYREENWYSQKKNILLDIFKNHARGKYVAYCEGDDYWTDPYKLQKQVDFLESHPDYVMCSHRFDQYYEEERRLEKEQDESFQGADYDLKNLIGGKWLTQTLTVMYRRSALDLQHYESYGMSMDIILFYALLKEGKGYCFPDVMGVYRYHNGGVWSEVSLNRRRLVEFKARLAIYNVEQSNEAAMFILYQFAKAVSRSWMLSEWKILMKVVRILYRHYGIVFVVRFLFFKMVLGRGMDWNKIAMIDTINGKVHFG